MATLKLIQNRKRTRDVDSCEKLIEVEIYFDDRKRMYINTGIKIEEQYFDQKNYTIKNNCPNYLQYKKYISALMQEIDSIYMQALDNKQKFTRDFFKEEWQKRESSKRKFLQIKGNYIELNSDVRISNNTNELMPSTPDVDSSAPQIIAQTNQNNYISWKKYRTLISLIEKYCSENQISITYNQYTTDYSTCESTMLFKFNEYGKCKTGIQ